MSGYWDESEQAFAQAAEDLTGTAQQEALYKRLLAAAQSGNDDRVLAAIGALLAADPKTYYFGPAHEMQARVLARQGKKNEAIAALEKVVTAPGMNVRDLFSAKYLQIWFSKTLGADTVEKWVAAERAYRDLIAEIDRVPTARRGLAESPRFRAMMSLGESLRGQGKVEDAKKLFDEILAASGETTDRAILAGVYYGLGDVAFEEASRLQATAAGTPATRARVKELLDTAALHYLRVTLHYREQVEQRELFGSTRGLARVFGALFALSNEKDCEMGRRAYDHFRQAVTMVGQGEELRLLVGEGKALKKRLDEVCKAEKTTEEEGEEPEGEGAR